MTPSNQRTLIGLAFMSVTAIMIIVAATLAGRTFFDHNLPIGGDGVYYFATLAEILRVAKTDGIAAALARVATGDSFLQILPWLTAAVLAPVLPLDYSAMALVNGVWYLALAVTLYIYFNRRLGSPALAVLISLPPLAITSTDASLGFSFVINGLPDANLALVPYLVGGSAVIWALASERLQRRPETLLAGLFLGLLALARPFTLGLIVPGLAPLVLAGLLTPDRIRRRRAWGNLGLAAAVALAIGGWWAIPRMVQVLRYSFFVWGKGNIGMISYAQAFLAWRDFLGDYVTSGISVVLSAALAWRVVAALRQCRPGRDWPAMLHWEALAAGAIPLAIMIILRSQYFPYGWPALVGLYVFMATPLRRPALIELDPTLRRPIFRALLATGCLLTLGNFLISLQVNHLASYSSRRQLDNIFALVADHARHSGRNEIRMDLAIHSMVNLGNVSSLAIFSNPCRFQSSLVTGPIPPQPVTNDCLPVRLTGGFRQMLDQSGGDLAARLDREVADMLTPADYVLVMAPDFWSHPDPVNAAISARLLAAGLEPLSGVLEVAKGDRVIVLARPAPGR